MVSNKHYIKPQADKDFYLKQAYERIPKIVKKLKVVTDREIKVRLEGEAFPGPAGPFPWVTGYALNYLLKDKVLVVYGYVGRRRIKGGVTNKFYCLSDTPYSEASNIIQQKRRVSADVNLVLTGEAAATYHAEDVFLEALENKLSFVLHKRDASEFRTKKASGVEGKKLPDIDFILERDGVFFGVDVKNWIRYEYETPKEILKKLKVCRELDLVPFMIVRYIDRGLTNYIIYQCRGLYLSLSNLSFRSLWSLFRIMLLRFLVILQLRLMYCRTTWLIR